MSRDFRIELLPFLAEFERKKKKKEKERKEQDDRRMLCKWRVGRKSSSLINYSSTFRARHARYPPKLERTCSRCQIRLDSAKWITSLHLPTLPSTYLQHSFQRCSAAVFYAPDTILSLLPLPSALIYVFARGKLSYLIIAHHRRRQIAILAPRSLAEFTVVFRYLPVFLETEKFVLVEIYRTILKRRIGNNGIRNIKCNQRRVNFSTISVFFEKFVL